MKPPRVTRYFVAEPFDRLALEIHVGLLAAELPPIGLPRPAASCRLRCRTCRCRWLDVVFGFLGGQTSFSVREHDVASGDHAILVAEDFDLIGEELALPPGSGSSTSPLRMQ